MEGKAFRQTSSPFSVHGGWLAVIVQHLDIARPSAWHWISPRQTGPNGLPDTRHPHRSVPPETLAICPSGMMSA